MPIVEALMSALVERYGEGKGRSMYYAMEATGQGPFGPKGKYHGLHLAFAKKHALQPIESRPKKKPAGPKARRARRPAQRR